MALELVGNCCTVNVGAPPAMYFMNGVPAPATLVIPTPMLCVPAKAICSNSIGNPVVMLLSSPEATRTPSTYQSSDRLVVAAPHGSAHWRAMNGEFDVKLPSVWIVSTPAPGSKSLLAPVSVPSQLCLARLPAEAK